MARRRPPRDLLAFLHLLSRFHYWDLCWHPSMYPVPAGQGLLPAPCCPLSVRLARAGWDGLPAGDTPAPPPLTSADFSSPSPGLPEQAACVRGWEGPGGGTVTPLILASVDAFRAGGGMEPGMAELAAGPSGSSQAASTWPAVPRPRRIAWPSLTVCLVSRIGSHQVSPPCKASS